MKETKYKNTEIGRIPEEWETCTILSQSNKLVVAFVGTCEKYYTNKGEGVMMLRTGDLKERSIDYTNIKYISYSFHNANKKSQLKKETFSLRDMVAMDMVSYMIKTMKQTR